MSCHGGVDGSSGSSIRAEELLKRESAIATLLRDSSESELQQWTTEIANDSGGDGGGGDQDIPVHADSDIAEQHVGGPVFSPEFYVRFNDALPPWHRRVMIRLWKPRFIGAVRNGGAHPVSLEPNVGWIPFGIPLGGGGAASFGGEAVNPQPRLAFVKGWGNPMSRIYGTCLVTHFRRGRFGVAYVALQRIEPSSDPASGAASGVSANCFEELARNVNFISAAVGSVDLSGTVLTLRDGTSPGQLSLMMHYNDSGHYTLEVLTLEQIDRWQELSTNTLKPDEPASDDIRDDAVSKERALLARRRYVQVIRALQMARASSVAFADLAVGSALRALMQEEVAVPEASDAYLPRYTDNNDVQLGNMRPFSFNDTEYL